MTEWRKAVGDSWRGKINIKTTSVSCEGEKD